MAKRITERTSYAGVEVKVKGQKALSALFKKLGGRVLDVSDKSVDLEFPTDAACDQYVAAAKANGAGFEAYDEDR